MTRTASPSMMKVVAAAVLISILWQPLGPLRNMTADALSLAATWIRD